MTEVEPALIEIKGLTKRFSGTLALDAVDFEITAGEVHALLGENGAGKSTLIKVLAGVYPADGGDIRWRGRRVDPMTEALRIAFIHQDLGLVDTMTVAENVAIVTGYPRRGGLISWRQARSAAAAALQRMGGGVDPQARVGDLPAAEKSIVAIARAMAVPCEVLVLDEPTAALPETDVALLLDALRRLRARGIGIVYVTHRLDEVFRFADRVTVLRDGRHVATDAVADTDAASLVYNIVGRSLSDLFVKPTTKAAETLLEVERLEAAGVGPLSFKVARGEIVGLVGLRGAGHDIAGRAIFGDVPLDAGRLTLGRETFDPADPAAMVARQVGFVSSKRGEESLAPSLTVRENLFVNPVATGTPLLSPIGPGDEQRRCLRALHRFSVRPPESERVIATLSGGNQQKVVLARWMEAASRLLILEEPTFGVDVGSKAEIYQLLQEGLDRGLSVLLVSSDFEEVAGVCHRALIFDRGRVIAELGRGELSIQRITALAAGGEANHARTA
ncbi:MAG: sugar ABC transporter ATP-binding protein [Methylobacteriaceae bacterium]|nr:sugar ABC transporter ATP-binding protein [Methylobacteriaceae bacterium]MBV9704874.1 sugar ABC transporter ATP-binding protein [Methylobacteriaceae bacterium]